MCVYMFACKAFNHLKDLQDSDSYPIERFPQSHLGKCESMCIVPRA